MFPYIVIGIMILLYGMIIFEDQRRVARREQLRQKAWLLVMNPPSDWKPYLGEQKTLFRSADDPDLLAEILRATAHRYADVALMHDYWIEIREIKVPQKRGQIEGQMTIRVVALPAASV